MTDLELYPDAQHQPFLLAAGDTHALLIPGFLGTPKEMRPLAESLAAAGVSARGALLPGFGPDVGSLGVVRAEAWLRAASDAWAETRKAARRTVLVGYSMGGAVALALAAKGGAPDALVLLAPHWRFADPRAAALPALKEVVKEFRPFANADFADPGTRQMFGELAPALNLDDPAIQSRLRVETTIPTRTLNEVRRIGRMAAASARKVRAPTTIVQGVADTTTLPAHTRLLALRLGGPLALLEVPGGHMLVEPAAPSWDAVRRIVVAAASAAAGR
ncbi:MAG: alpha/beta fold hydrolase [Thermomicrobiales bacterium]|nr:alpha/beta fold hydrolase [Thermomicrobiales bacterium]